MIDMKIGLCYPPMSIPEYNKNGGVMLPQRHKWQYLPEREARWTWTDDINNKTLIYYYPKYCEKCDKVILVKESPEILKKLNLKSAYLT